MLEPQTRKERKSLSFVTQTIIRKEPGTRVKYYLPILLVMCSLATARSQEIFSQLNLEYPGLGEVQKALQRNDTTSAKRALLTYFQTRTNRRFSHFELKGDLKQALENSENRFSFRMQRHDFGRTIDWKWTGVDKEWNFTLNRMQWLVNYAGVYKSTGDERLARAFVAQVESWMTRADHPGYPRSIDTGNRLSYWCVAHWYFVQRFKSPSVTPEFNARMLSSMAAQAEFLYAPENWRRNSNWGTFENSGLAWFALMFPEFRRSEAWLNEIRFRMQYQMMKSYHSDGLHIEVSPSYHARELEVWFELVRSAEENQVRFTTSGQLPSRPVKEQFLPAAEALMYILRPNGTLPPVGDTDAEDQLELLRDLGGFLDRTDLLYVASRGRKGTIPSQTSKSFPQGGYYVMRSGWGSEATSIANEYYLLFDCGTNQPWHAHYDILNMIVDANGNELLIDPGRFTYNEDEERAYFKGTPSHNTVVIDKTDQPRYYTPSPATWISTSSFDHVSGENAGNPRAVHRRSVFFVKPHYWIVMDYLQGSGSHRYDQYWHLSEKVHGQITVDARKNSVKTPHMILASTVSDDRFALHEGWTSPSYRVKVKAPVVVRSSQSSSSVVWPTAIIPFIDAPPEVMIQSLPVTASNSTAPKPVNHALKIELDGSIDYFFEQLDTPTISRFDQFATDGAVLFVRMNKKGEPVTLFLAQGSFVSYRGDTLLAFSGKARSAAFRDERLEIDATCPLSFSLGLGHVLEVRRNEERVPIRKSGNRWIEDAKR